MNEAIVSLISMSAMIGLAWATPGPNMFAVMHVSLSSGKVSGIITGLGIAAGNIMWASLAVVGLDQLFHSIPELLIGLQVLGCLYLFFLAFKSLQSARTKPKAQGFEQEERPAKTPFLIGLGVILTNPKAILFFAAIFTTLIPPSAPLSWKLTAIALSGIIPAVGHTFTASVLSLPSVRAKYIAQQQKVSILFAVIFAVVAIQIGMSIFK
jgi:threonine/homoserine/homoserine lactone efflux protein